MSFRQYRGFYSRPSFGFGPALTDWVRILLIINVAVFLVQMIAGPSFTLTFGLVPADVLGKLRLWQLVTYMFLHGGFFHILFNMFMLWMFGSEMERTWGSDTFIRFYFFTGIGAGVLSWITAPGSTSVTIGASGAIFGILLAYAMTYPNRMVLVYFLFPVKVKYLVIFLGALEFLAAFNYTAPGIAHFGHLGGLLFGYIYIRWFGVSSYARPRGSGSGWWDPASWSEALRKWRTKRRFKVIDLQNKRDAERRREVDLILEKIAREGMGSLTARERRILEEESDRGGMDA
jgi:membrane associated rhomboid family serine protease